MAAAFGVVSLDHLSFDNNFTYQSGGVFLGVVGQSNRMATTVGEALREARKKRGLSLRDLEKVAKMSSSQISQIETGVRADPAFGTVLRLARAIGVSIDTLLAGDEDEVVSDLPTALELLHAETLRTLRRLEKLIEMSTQTKSKAPTRRKRSAES